MMKKFFPLVIGVYSGIGSLGLLWLFQELGCNSNISVFFVLICVIALVTFGFFCEVKQMYYLYDQIRKQYISSVISTRRHGGGYALYYDDVPNSCCRWATEKGAQRCIDRIVNAGTLPLDHSVMVVYVP